MGSRRSWRQCGRADLSDSEGMGLRVRVCARQLDPPPQMRISRRIPPPPSVFQPPPSSSATLRSVAVHSFSNNQTVLHLWGAWQGSWQLVQLPLPLPSDPVSLRGAITIPFPSLCLGGFVIDGPLFFMALERTSGLVLVRGLVQDWEVVMSQPVEGVGGEAVTNALTSDSFLGALFLAFNNPAEPSQLYKVNATTMLVYGIKKMRNRGGAPHPPPFCESEWATP